MTFISGLVEILCTYSVVTKLLAELLYLTRISLDNFLQQNFKQIPNHLEVLLEHSGG